MKDPRAERIERLKERMRFFEEKKEYGEAINTLAELIKLGCRDADVIFAGARDYFFVGDFERAAKWVNMTLDFAPAHIGARLLLARLFLVKDKLEEALAVYDFVAKHFRERLSDDERDEMQDVLMFYARYRTHLVAFYPNIVKFLVEEYNMKKLLSVVKWPE